MLKKTRIIPPKLLNGYQFGKFIGQGSFASVYEATNLLNNEKYAIKIFPREKIKTEKELRRFQHEIQIMAYFKSPYIVHLFDFFSDDLNYYLVFDLCKGGELYDYIIENDKIGEKTAATMFKQICLAISYSHSKNYAHRDIKPQNILITEFPSVKVADFGLAGYFSPDFNLLTSFCGSPLYLAPECMRRVDYDGQKSDIWSLGILLYTMVVGRAPFDSSNIQTLFQKIMTESISFPSHVSKQCRNLITIMLQVNPTERASMDEILNHPWMQLAELPEISQEEKERLEAESTKPQTSNSQPIRLLAAQNKDLPDSLKNKDKSIMKRGSESCLQPLPSLKYRKNQKVRTNSVAPNITKVCEMVRSHKRTRSNTLCCAYLPYIQHV